MSEFCSRADFLAGSERRYGELELPSGKRVRYRSLTEAEHSKFEMDSLKKTRDGLRHDPDRARDARARLIVLCLCDSAGSRLLTDADAELVNDLDAADTAMLYDVLRDHCGIAARVDRDAKKNGWNGTGGSDSHTGSPPTSELQTSNNSASN